MGTKKTGNRRVTGGELIIPANGTATAPYASPWAGRLIQVGVIVLTPGVTNPPVVNSVTVDTEQVVQNTSSLRFNPALWPLDLNTAITSNSKELLVLQNQEAFPVTVAWDMVFQLD